jgi:hypothetical protein
MKKTLIFVAILYGQFLNAQLEKNSLFIVTFIQARYYSLFNSFSRSIGSGLTPSIGFMLSNKWALGAEFNYKHLSLNSENYYKQFTLSAFTRYYLVNEKRYAMYANLQLGYGRSEVNFPDYLAYPHLGQTLIVGKIGLAGSYFIDKNLSLDFQTNLSLPQEHSNLPIEGKFGLHYYLGQKNKKIKLFQL